MTKWYHKWFDRLPGGVQRVVYIAAAAIAYAGINYVDQNWLSWKLPTALQFALAIVVPLAVGYLTPITEQIGRKGGVPDIATVVDAATGQTGAKPSA